jgi:hypothetical protein
MDLLYTEKVVSSTLAGFVKEKKPLEVENYGDEETEQGCRLL